MTDTEAGGVHNTRWSEERVALLKKLRAEGRSAAACGRVLGVSRNAVIGKWLRLGLCKVKGPRGKWGEPRPLRHRPLPKMAAISLSPAGGIRSKPRLTVEAKQPVTATQARIIDDNRQRARIAKRQRVKAGLLSPAELKAKMTQRFAPGFAGQEGRVALMDLASGMCRFPIDMPADDHGRSEVRYCGDKVEPGRSWCPHHAARCFAATAVGPKPS